MYGKMKKHLNSRWQYTIAIMIIISIIIIITIIVIITIIYIIIIILSFLLPPPKKVMCSLPFVPFCLISLRLLVRL